MAEIYKDFETFDFIAHVQWWQISILKVYQKRRKSQQKWNKNPEGTKRMVRIIISKFAENQRNLQTTWKKAILNTGLLSDRIKKYTTNLFGRLDEKPTNFWNFLEFFVRSL